MVNKYLIVDGNAVLHRAYYALPDWRNRSGEATAGVYGFLSMLLKANEELKPTHLIVVFDTPEPTFRHLMYVGYQYNREKDRQVSEDIWGQVEKLKAVFEKVGVPVFSVKGFEADDVIGTISGQCTVDSGQNEVIIITGDKDLMQLVTDKVKLYMPMKGLSDNQIIDKEKVFEKLGVRPDQVVDYKALVGDTSDNYPGVPGIGPVTAKKLLEKYGSFEKIFSSTTPHPPPKLGGGAKECGILSTVWKKLAEGYESGELSKRLATINRQVPISISNIQCSIPVDNMMAEVSRELGYKSLVRRTVVKADQQASLF